MRRPAKAKVLAAFSVSEAEWQVYLANRNARKKTTPIPEFVQVTGTGRNWPNPIEQRMAADVGKPVDTAKLDAQMLRLQGQGRFCQRGLLYGRQRWNAGTADSNREQALCASDCVRPILLIDGSDYNNVLFSIGARITFLDFGSYRSELRSDVIVGSQYLLDAEYYHPFTPTSNWFMAPRGSGNSQQNYVYNGDTETAIYRTRPGPRWL